MGEVIPFRPKASMPPPRYDTGPLTAPELVRVEELLREARAAKLAGQRRRELPTVFTNGGAPDEPLLPCPLTDVSWLDELDGDAP